MAGQVSSELANADVFDLEGAKHRLGDSWKSQPVVLVFVRHFG